MIQIVTGLQKFLVVWGGGPAGICRLGGLVRPQESPKERSVKGGDRGSASREIRVLDSEGWAGEVGGNV